MILQDYVLNIDKMPFYKHSTTSKFFQTSSDFRYANMPSHQ